MTVQWADRTTRSATLPRNRCDTPVRPCVPMTMRSACSSRADRSFDQGILVDTVAHTPSKRSRSAAVSNRRTPPGIGFQPVEKADDNGIPNIQAGRVRDERVWAPRAATRGMPSNRAAKALACARTRTDASLKSTGTRMCVYVTITPLSRLCQRLLGRARSFRTRTPPFGHTLEGPRFVEEVRGAGHDREHNIARHLRHRRAVHADLSRPPAGVGPMRPVVPSGGSRFPWKSLIARSWTATVPAP